jgi:hypothetical protein
MVDDELLESIHGVRLRLHSPRMRFILKDAYIYTLGSSS